jgi:membrane-bound lytic murein transglycosylase D
MRRIFISVFIFSALINLCSAINIDPADTTKLYQADTMAVNQEIFDTVVSNFDSNIDSMMNLYYVKEALPEDFNKQAEASVIFIDFPDSVYIERLAAIPTTVGLTYNRVVKNYIDVYTKKKHSSVEVMLGLSEHYFPIFDEIFDYYDVPNEMKYMAIIESALNPKAYSRTRAVGIWQFMYGTGRMYGLEINSLVDERRDPIKATDAAARFSKDLYNIYGDWLLVIAAYNCGPGNVNRAIRRSGGKTNYWDIYQYLPLETRGHVPAFIAATYVMNYYSEHNLVPAKVDLPILTDTILIKQPLHFQQVADVLGVSIQEIRDLNPQYRNDIIPAGRKTYSLSLPEKYTLSFIDYEDSIFHYKDSILFDPAKITAAPASHDYASFVPEAPGADYMKLTYTVKAGDNVGFISEWYDVRVSDLNYWNNIHRNMIRSGQKLAIYKHKNKAANYKGIDNMSFAEKQALVGKTVSVAPQANSTTTTVNSGDFVYYKVQWGDTLWDIAKKYPGVTDTDIMRLNNITDASKIKPGQTLKIKPKS